MGSGIAAHLANLGYDVDLLDLNREATAAAWERALKLKPPHLYDADFAGRVRTGGIDLDLERVREADWVCEAIYENLDAKRALYAQVIPYLRENALFSTNTSSLPLADLTEGMPDGWKRRFVGTHFFNPPRYLKLLELIPTSETDPSMIPTMTHFLEERVARRVVVAKDTPGFIANRFGMWAMFHAVHTAERLRLSIEQVDAICGPFLGRPRSAAFRLNDLVGLDVMAFIAGIVHERSPEDPYRDTLQLPKSLQFLLDKGWTGQKAGQGYFHKFGKELLAFDLDTHAYRNSLEVNIPSLTENAKLPLGTRVRNALQARDEAGEFLREHLIPVLKYAEYLKAEISHTVQDFDRVMQWGFGWEAGPFAMIDQIGPDVLGMEPISYYPGSGLQLGFSGDSIATKREPEYRTITDYPLIEKKTGFNLRDLEDGVTGVCLTTKLGVVGPALVDELTEFFTHHTGPTVLATESKSFSAGFDLKFFLEKIDAKDWAGIDAALKKLQDLTILLSQRPVVAAVHGFCLGGGLELAIGCPQIAALADASLGFPEAKVGLIPGGAGTCRMRQRYQTSAADLATGAMMLMAGTVSASAPDAQRLRILRKSDVIVFHPDRLITEARALAARIQPTPQPTWLSVEGPVVGMIDRQQEQVRQKGEASEHDAFIGDRVKAVFAKTSSFDEALVKEREEFVVLCQHALSVARIRHMVETNKPLRN